MSYRYSHISTLLFLLMFLSLEISAQFEVQKSGTTKDLLAVYFTDRNQGYACGKDGAFLKTQNGGKVWSNLSISTVDNLNGLYFKNPDTGFVIGESNIFMRTRNAAFTWEEIELSMEADLTAITFVTDSIGYVLGHGIQGGILLRTIDGGETWEGKLINENCRGTTDDFIPGLDCDDFYLFSMSFISPMEGILGGFSYNYRVGKKPFICKTTDGGNTFIDISPELSEEDSDLGSEIVSVNYMSQHDACAILNSGRGKSFLYVSDYYVDSFEPNLNGPYYNYQELYFSSWFVDRLIGYFSCLVEGKPQIIKTIDLGDSYMFLNPPTENSLYATHFTDQFHGHFVGQNGTILRFTDENNVVHDSFIMNEEYFDPPFSIASPNNRSTRTQIQVYNMTVEDLNNLDVVLYDKFGTKVGIKRSKTKEYTDEIRMKIVTKELDMGTYFYSIKVNDETKVNGKLVIGGFAQLTSK